MADDQQQTESTEQDQQQGNESQRTDNAGGDDGDGDDLGKLKTALGKERQRARELEREVKPLRTFKQERESSEKTASEKVAARIAELEGQVTTAQQRERTYALRDAIEEAVSGEKLTLAAPVGRLLKLIDGEAVDWSDDGKPQNATALLKGLVKSDPYLFAARRVPSADGGAGRESGSGVPSINDQIRRMAGRTG